MKKFISTVRSGILATTVILLSSVIFLACNKDNNDNIDTPAAGLMAFNLSPDQSAVGFSLSGNNLTNAPLGYTNYTGAYLGIYPGQRTVDAYDFNTSSGSIASVQGNFEIDKYYSVFLVGADSNYRNILVNDNVDTLSDSSGHAFVRYINAIPDSVSAPTVTLTVGGNNIVNSPAAYATVSDFVEVDPGELNIAVKNNDGIDASRAITVEAKKVYTILLVGMPGSGPTTTPVEIKYIGNGTLDDANRTSSTGRVALIK